MNDPRPAGPRFPGELADHLPTRDTPPDRWADRVRHSWVIYTTLAVALPVWIGLMVLAVVFMGPFGWIAAMLIALVPVGVYLRVLVWRHLTNRDMDTGERLDRRAR